MATDLMPIVLIGALGIGAFVLIQNPSIIQNLFPPATPPAAPASPYPASGISSTVSGVSSTSTPSAMGTDLITGQPCPCSSPTGTGAILHHHYKRVRDSRGHEQILIIPAALGGASSSTCNCGSSSSSILGGAQPSQFTSVGDLNNFIGSSIAQAAYRLG